MTEVSTDEAQSLDLLAVFEPNERRDPTCEMMPTAKGCVMETELTSGPLPSRRELIQRSPVSPEKLPAVMPLGFSM